MIKKPTLDEYNGLLPRSKKLEDCLRTQLSELLGQQKITLGVPMESRIKDWKSVNAKLENSQINEISQITDLVGLRLILLFRSDLETTEKLIEDNLKVLSIEDTAERLDESQFGYQSRHYLVQVPSAWIELPIYAELKDFGAEIQVRTLAQHIWAAASHKLQYKKEDSVPKPLRRSINRISALLETVDLEFERLISERANYIENTVSEGVSHASLNVDIIEALLDQHFPEKNKLSDDEDYSELATQLKALGIETREEFEKIIVKHKKTVILDDKRTARQYFEQDFASLADRGRLEKGVWYTHVGLARSVLMEELGTEAVHDSMPTVSVVDADDY